MARAAPPTGFAAATPSPQFSPPVVEILVEEQPLQKLAYGANVVLAFLMTPYGALLVGALIAAYIYRATLLSNLWLFLAYFKLIFRVGGEKQPNTLVLVNTLGEPIDVRTATKLGMLDALAEYDRIAPPNASGPRGVGNRAGATQ
jgi:hypothetical protein